MVVELRQKQLADELTGEIEKAAARNEILLPVGTGSHQISWESRREPRRLNLAAYSRIERLAREDFYIVAQPGVKLAELHELLKQESLRFPFLTAGCSGTIGGMVASGRLRAGEQWCDISRWVLSVEVLLADGSVSRSGAVTYKSVAGYDLPRLFSGSYGTLGVIIEASLRLYPESARAYGKNLEPVRGRIPRLTTAREILPATTVAAKIGRKLKEGLDPQGIFPVIAGWK